MVNHDLVIPLFYWHPGWSSGYPNRLVSLVTMVNHLTMPTSSTWSRSPGRQVHVRMGIGLRDSAPMPQYVAVEGRAVGTNLVKEEQVGGSCLRR